MSEVAPWLCCCAWCSGGTGPTRSLTRTLGNFMANYMDHTVRRRRTVFEVLYAVVGQFGGEHSAEAQADALP